MSSQIPFLSPGEMEALMSLPSGGLGAASAMTGMYPPASLSSASSCNFFALAPNQPGMHVAGMMGLPQTQRPVPEFLYHLTRMLREPSSHRLIEWDAGRILVHDPVRLESEVLGKYYRHSKYSSFQRQLNYFGFKKISGKGKMSPCSYINDAATADLGCLLNIRRKTATKGIEKREREAALAAAKAANMRCVVTYTPETQAEDFYAEGADAKLLDFSSGVEVGALFSPEGAVLPELLPGVRDPRP